MTRRPLPPGFELRPARDEDAEAVAALSNDEAEALVGFRPDSADFHRGWWTAPSVDRENDIAALETVDGTLCGFVAVAADPPYTEVFAVGAVALAYHGRGLGAALVRESRRRAARFVALAAPGERVVMHHGALADEPRVSALLAAQGYREVRRFELMRVDFGRDELQPPIWPAGAQTRTLRDDDAPELYRAHREAFVDHWGETQETEEDFRHFVFEAERFDPSLWLLAWSGGELAGYVGANLEAEEDSTRGYVTLLGVRPRHRRLGLGEALLRHTFRELRARGKSGCDLHVDDRSPTGATRLYERVGMTRYPRFATWERELRPRSPSAVGAGHARPTTRTSGR